MERREILDQGGGAQDVHAGDGEEGLEEEH